jgi:hypothetical protein
MGLGELLTTEEKIVLLDKMKKSVSVHIYTLCLQLGFDPESFEYSTYVCSDGDSTTGFINPRLVELEKHSKNLVSVVEKIEALRNA